VGTSGQLQATVIDAGVANEPVCEVLKKLNNDNEQIKCAINDVVAKSEAHKTLITSLDTLVPQLQESSMVSSSTHIPRSSWTVSGCCCGGKAQLADAKSRCQPTS